MARVRNAVRGAVDLDVAHGSTPLLACPGGGRRSAERGEITGRVRGERVKELCEPVLDTPLGTRELRELVAIRAEISLMHDPVYSGLLNLAVDAIERGCRVVVGALGAE